MAYFYVKNGGTKVSGSSLTPLTGTFAALGVTGYYNNVLSAIDNGGASVGDYIYVSDSHVFYYTTAADYDFPGDGIGSIIAVNDGAIDSGRRSGFYAKEGLDAGFFLTWDNVFLSGIEIGGVTLQRFSAGATSSVLIMDDCRSLGSTINIGLSSDGCAGNITNTEISLSTSGDLDIRGSSIFNIINCTIAALSTTVNYLISDSFTAGGGTLNVNGSDLSIISNTLIHNVGSSPGNNTVSVRMDNCKIHPEVTFTNETFKSYSQRALFTRCSSDAAAMEYQYHLHAFGGDIFDDTAEYRNEDTPFTLSNQKVSYQVTTNTDASLSQPLWFDFPISKFVTLSTTSTLKFYLTSNDATLTDKDIYITVNYPDGTTYTTNRNVNSAPLTVGGTIDILANGTALTTDATSTWLVGKGNNYEISLPCVSGADCQPTIKVYVTKPSVVFYLASDFGAS